MSIDAISFARRLMPQKQHPEAEAPMTAKATPDECTECQRRSDLKHTRERCIRPLTSPEARFGSRAVAPCEPLTLKTDDPSLAQLCGIIASKFAGEPVTVDRLSIDGRIRAGVQTPM